MPRQNFHPSRSICVRAAVYALVISAAVLSLSPAFTRLTVLAQSETAPADSGGVQPLAEFVRALSLPASDIVYNPADQMLYASVPSSAGAAGNSIVPIDPATGEMGAPVFVGSEPSKLALSDDGHTLYVSLDGSYTIRRFDTATRAPSQQFSLGTNFHGNYVVSDLAVAPGNPNLVAVARHYAGTSPPGAGVVVFDNGVQRTKAGPDHSSGSDYIAFSATASKLYGSGIYSGLLTLTIDASGVTVTPGKNIPDVRSRIKFVDGRIYSSTGQVANPETSTLLGTFSGVSTSAFAIDTVAGRAYYLVRENFGSSALTLKAFDLNTFVPVGSATLSGITGDPASMVRWGANGLAFRTDAGKLYLVQTSLIPSPEAIPTPTPVVSPTATPTPPPVPTFVRQIPLLANDLIYSAQSQQLYASVPSAAGAKGNSVTRLNPETGEIGPSIFVGSEPTRLALADDGQTMYVGLSGAGAVRKLDVSAQTASLKFNLGNSNFDGPLLPDDIAVMPGSPGTVAVSKFRSGDGGATIYDEGVPRTQSITQGGPLEFASPTRLYAGSNSVQKVAVDQNGLTRLSSFNTAGSGQTQLAGGLLYLSNGIVVDPENGVNKGRFTSLGFYNAMMIDTAKNRAFFLTNNTGSGWSLRSYELDTFRHVASVAVQGVPSGVGGDPSSLVRWGKNGLAFRASGRIFLIQTALVDASDPIPAATPTPSPTPSPTPVYIPTIVDKVNLPANDLVINAATQTLYASVPSTAGEAAGNSITSIDPKTGTIGASTFVGSEPNKLALSDDGQVLYVNLDGAKAVRRFDTATKTPGTQFTIGVDRPTDMEVVPGSPQSLAVSRGSTFGTNGGVAVYDNGVQRPNTSNGSGGFFSSFIGPIEFGASPAKLYGYNSNSSGFEITKMEVDASGIKTLGVVRNLLSGFSSGFEFAGGKLYSAGGSIADPETDTLVGRFNSGGSVLAVDQALGRVFFLSSSTFGPGMVLSAYDINTFLPLGSVTLPGVNGSPAALVRWGTNGLAFCTFPNTFTSPATPSQIYLVRSALVSDAEPLPSILGFSAATYNAFEGTSGVNAVITVTRTGGLTGATTINYATSGGTATPGSDYTETSGTLSFADGEMSKTFVVRITDDNLFEGNVRETINLTLSSPTGDARLGSQTTATLTIQDNDGRPSITAGNMTVLEGQSGTTDASFAVRLSNPSIEVISVNYATADRTATAPSDYVAATGTLTFQPGEVEKTIPLQIKGDTVDEGDEQFAINFTNPVNVHLFGATGFVTILVDERSVIRFSAPEFAASEGDGRALVTVVRVGANTEPASVGYLTLDDARAIRCDDNTASREAAFARCDYMTTFDTLVFAPGESQKTFTVPLVDDGHDEPREFVQLRLTTPTGTTLAAPSSALLLINDNDEADQPNPVDAHNFFVRQHYLDFLSREPDAEGLAAWTGVLAGCANAFNTDANNPAALCDRNVVSSSFFRSTEFELKGYFVYRFYRVAFNRRPTYDEFVADMRRVTGQTAEEVYTRRRAFAEAWVLRPEFLALHDAKTNAVYVDSLLGRYGLTAVNTPDPANPDGDSLQRFTRDELVAALDAAPQRLTRAQVLRAVVQSREIETTEYNGAFVAMQYYGYLRRTPETDGYEAWLAVITRGDGYRVMVNGFMNSTEYRLRFGK
jgi:sugar lactone lactonase YvrE